MRRALLVIALLALSREAHAGRQLLTWSLDTETLPERSVELEQWITDRTGDWEAGTGVWWGPIIGVTDKLEVALPVLFSFAVGSGGAGPATNLDAYGLDVRYRLVSADPVTAPRIVPLVRGSIQRLVRNREALIARIDGVVSGDFGRVHAVIDVGLEAQGEPSNLNVGVAYGFGASVRVTGDVHAGAELYAEKGLDQPVGVNGWITTGPLGWIAVGPNVAWTHGRFWITASYLRGVNAGAPTNIPRVIWGILF